MNNTVPIKRWNILKKVIDGEVTLKTASLQMGVSYRQAVRMKQSVMKDGIRGLIHGNTGRRPANALEETLKSKILDWSRNGYGGLTDTSFVETLEKDKGVKISRETARKIRRSGGIQPGKARRQPRQTVTAGRPREGLSIFWDGMIHQWFAREPYACCLLAAIDDASGRCLAARFFPFEESLAYLFILQTVVRECGIPEKIIQDCNPLLLRNDTDWSIDEQLQGKQEPTQVG
ncbi:MAG: helix-turn-helix domain-containing protein, partial [Deltaproteobacteria bacterium]|nr:helix-turn-helix domain-containing protein [Deltaproteobacteria bacterium]